MGSIPIARSKAHIAQSVEHFLGKEEVTGSNPVVGLKVMADCAIFVYCVMPAKAGIQLYLMVFRVSDFLRGATR